LTASVRAGPSTGGSSFYCIGFSWNGQNTVDSYKEFFIVTRAKDLRHSPPNTQHDFLTIHAVVIAPGQSIDIPYGAGDETVQVGESGYNAQGQSREFDGSNGYQYLYPYRYIWIDLTIIRTSNYQKLKWSDTYESLLWIQSNEERLRFCSCS